MEDGSPAIPPFPPTSDPLLTALGRSPHLGRLTELRLSSIQPSRSGLRMFAQTELVARITLFGLEFVHNSRWEHYHTVEARQPPAGTIRDAILRFADEYADMLPES